jgi:glutathione-independent formaldehyde dehydrogenase
VHDANESELRDLRASRSEACPPARQLIGERLAEAINPPTKLREIDAGVDAVGFEARGHGQDAAEALPATVLNSLMDLTRAGGALGIPGLYVTGDPGAKDEAARHGSLSIRIGLGWAKSHSFTTGQTPVK